MMKRVMKVSEGDRTCQVAAITISHIGDPFHVSSKPGDFNRRQLIVSCVKKSQITKLSVRRGVRSSKMHSDRTFQEKEDKY